MKIMEILLNPIIELIKALIVHKEGTKFLVTLAGIGGIVYMHVAGIATLSTDIVIPAIVAIYYLADIYSKNKVTDKWTTTTVPIPTEWQGEDTPLRTDEEPPK